jgi:hypothetical protein
MVTKAADTGIICYACGVRGHIKHMCKKGNGKAVRQNNAEN